MVILDPTGVRFGERELEGVSSVAIDRAAEREIVAWGDAGPHAVWADVPEQRLKARVVQTLQRGTIEGPRPGEMGALTLVTRGVDQSRLRVSAIGVVTRVTHAVRDVSGGMPASAIARTIELVLVSSDGSADPVSVEQGQ